jgi:DNA-binding protein Fis
VRELRNAIHVHAAIGELPRDRSTPSDDELTRALERTITAAMPYADLKDDLVERFTAIYLRRLMAETGNNQSEAARVSGLDRSYLRRLLAKFDLLR